jgi:hypothetical protein
VTPPPQSTESPSDAGVTPPSSAGSFGQVAEDQVQQSTVELKDRLPENGLMGWLSKALLVAVIAMAVLLGAVIYLFIRWRSTGRKAVALSPPEKNSEVGIEKGPEGGPLETPIGKNNLVRPLVDRMISDQTGQGPATSMRQNSEYSSNVETTSEVGPNTVSIENSATDGSAVEDVARLAKLYAMGTPSEQEFQLLKNLIPQGDFQQPKVA